MEWMNRKKKLENQFQHRRKKLIRLKNYLIAMTGGVSNLQPVKSVQQDVGPFLFF